MDEGGSIVIGVCQLLTLFEASMPCMTLPSSPVISICIRRYPKRKDESIPWIPSVSDVEE